MKTRTLLPALLVLSCCTAQAADNDGNILSHAQTPIVRPSFYDPFGGDFFVQLDGFIHGLFLSQTHDSTDPVEINDLPLVTLGDDSDAYDWALTP